MFQIKHRVLLTWIVSYLLLLTLPILIGAVQLANVRRLLENEYKSFNAYAQKEISQQLDEKINELKTISRLIQNNALTNTYIQRGSAPDLSERYALKDVAEYFRSSSSYSDVSDCYLYINNEDVIVTTSSVTSRDLVQEPSFSSEILQSLDFDQYIHTYHSYTIDTVEDRQTHVRRLMLITSLPSTSYFAPKATLFQVIKPAIIKAALSNMAIDDAVNIFLFDGEGQLVSQRLDNNMAASLDLTRFEGSAGQIETSIQGKKTLVFYSTLSSLPGFRCLLIVPYAVLDQKTTQIRQNNLLFVLFSFVLGFLLAMVFIYYNYQPVRRIIRQINPFSSNPEQDAFEQIANTFNTVINQNSKLMDLYEQQKTFLQDKFMESALQNGIVDSPATREILRSFGMTFLGNLFCVLVISPVQDEWPDDLKCMDEWQSELRGNAVFYWLDIDNQRAILINFNADSFADSYQAFCTIALAWIQEKQILAAISHICFSLNTINSCYHEATEKLFTNRLQYQETGLLPANPFQHKECQLEYGLSRLQEDALYQALCSGDYQGSLKTACEILQRKSSAPRKGCQSNNLVYAYGIINVIWRVAREIPGTDDCIISHIADLSNKYLQSQEDERIAAIAGLIEYVCAKFRHGTRDAGQPLISRITACVKTNFMKSDFNVSGLSDMLGMNLSYLSKYFKANTGVGLLDYINRVRIEKGKELMSQHNISVSKTAEMVGFDNLNSFIRVFKKYELKTPGDFMVSSKETTNS